MKKALLKILCLVMALFMAFSAAGCGGSSNEVADAESEEDFDLNFGGNGGTGTNTGDNTGDNTGTDNQGGTTNTAAIPNADSLNFSQLVSQMPSSLRGTTLRMYNWNPAKEYTGSESVISKFEQMTGIKVQWEAGSYDD
ncbi:MAG: hypothetical protein IKZ47_06220 [Clostridia bacterium]|nr:hypothetical protein [Clostridia bacterium]